MCFQWMPGCLRPWNKGLYWVSELMGRPHSSANSLWSWRRWEVLPDKVGNDANSFLQSGTTLRFVLFFNTLEELTEDLDEVALLTHFFPTQSAFSSSLPFHHCWRKDHFLKYPEYSFCLKSTFGKVHLWDGSDNGPSERQRYLPWSQEIKMNHWRIISYPKQVWATLRS